METTTLQEIIVAGVGNLSIIDTNSSMAANITSSTTSSISSVYLSHEDISWSAGYTVGIPIITIVVFVVTLVIVYLKPSRAKDYVEAKKQQRKGGFETVANSPDNAEGLTSV